MEAIIAIQHPCLLGEGAIWDVRSDCVRWLDVLQGMIHSYFPSTGKHTIVQLDTMVGAIVPRSAGGFIAAMQHGFALLEIERGGIEMKTQPEKGLLANRFNDGKCDPEGRFWAGTMAFDETHQAGKLYMLDKDFQCMPKITNTTISNGMAWNKAHTRFYYIDTPTMQVMAYDYDKTTGNISHPKVVITVQEQDGFPDGMTIDDEDKLWIAHYNGWQVIRYDPETGAILLRIPLPVAKVTCCTFGGPAMNDLYITTANKEMSPEEHAAQPLAGSLFVVKNMAYKGFAPFEFAG
jgi:sugar lactone lactonase YvrE